MEWNEKETSMNCADLVYKRLLDLKANVPFAISQLSEEIRNEGRIPTPEEIEFRRLYAIDVLKEFIRSRGLSPKNPFFTNGQYCNAPVKDGEGERCEWLGRKDGLRVCRNFGNTILPEQKESGKVVRCPECGAYIG